VKDSRGKLAADHLWDDDEKEDFNAMVKTFVDAHPEINYVIPKKPVPISMKDKNGELMNAARAGDSGFTTDLLDAGANVNFKEEFSEDTPLCRAILSNHWEVADILLQRGADPNVVCPVMKDTPFIMSHKNKNFALYLLGFGANPYVKDSRGKLAADHLWDDDEKEDFNAMVKNFVDAHPEIKYVTKSSEL